MRATDSQTMLSVLTPFRSALYHTKTLYLFTKSDIMTTILPDFCIAIALTRQTSPVYLLNTVLWIWLILLTFCVSNQASTQSLIEDQVNKPWRPIPSSRITLRQARILRWVLVFISLLVSAYLGNLVAAVVFLLADIVYNDLRLSTWWFTKSLLNGVGYAGFQYGAVAVASASNGFVDPETTEAIMVFGLLIFTTIQAQDFYDAKGDAASGRKTVATLYPTLSRIVTASAITAWSFILPVIWDTTLVASTLFFLLGTFVAVRFAVLRDQKSDEASFLHYNIWLLFACVLPAFREVRYLA